MLNQKSIVTPELIDKLANLKAVFIAFNPEQFATIITALEIYSELLSNEQLVKQLNPNATVQDRDAVAFNVFQTLSKIDETFNDEFQAKQTKRILSNF
jgi:cell division protein ZapA (FtsZ GTPase activity inhibitor)